MEKAINFNDVAIVSVKGNDYRIHFLYMSKGDPISIMNNSNLSEKMRALYFFLCIKMSEYNSIERNSFEGTYYQKNRDVILNRAKDYYKNDKKKIF